MFGWKTIASVLGAFVLIATAYTTAANFAWAFPAHRGYVQFTAEELQAYVLKQVGELTPVLNMLVRDNLEDRKRREEIRKSEIADKVNRARREVESAATARERALLAEIIDRSVDDMKKSDDVIKELGARITKIEAER